MRFFCIILICILTSCATGGEKGNFGIDLYESSEVTIRGEGGSVGGGKQDHDEQYKSRGILFKIKQMF